MSEGFNIGTYFADHLEDAIAFGGPYVFFVEFDDEKFNGPVDWQFHLRGRVLPDKIKRLVQYTPNIIYTKTETSIENTQKYDEE